MSLDKLHGRPSLESPSMEISGLNELWAETLGDPRVCIAILDGPVDQSHSSLAAADLTHIETVVSGVDDRGPASQHGTHIASVIFAHHDGLIKGIAPCCRGLIIPVFKDRDALAIAPCSQVDIARSINQAVHAGAHIINISGGELSHSGTAHPLLADAVMDCAKRGVLIIAAAGNDGCDCLHIPGALPSVLVVGAMNARGEPIDFSNWGTKYQTHGILAPGENILGASPGDSTVTRNGTSYATSIISGTAGLLLSLQLKLGRELDPNAVRAAILNSAAGCNEKPVTDCRRLLAGRLNVKSAMSQITRGMTAMPDSNEITENPPFENDAISAPATTALQSPVSQLEPAHCGDGTSDCTVENQPLVSTASREGNHIPAEKGSVSPSDVKAAACECGGTTPQQLVFALGQLGYDFGTEARRDSIMQHMEKPANPQDPIQLLGYLKDNFWDAAAIIWTINLDTTPIYAIQAQGGFASDTYRRLVEFFGEQAREETERVSIPGHIAGTARLSTGQTIPIIWPVLRGMYSWNTLTLVQAACGSCPPDKAAQKEKDEYNRMTQAVANFLHRVYEELRNLGITPQDRAINYAATNAFQVTEVCTSAIQEEMELDSIDVERSPVCRPDSDCWDVKLTFFHPKKVFEQARRVYRFTVDVSDDVPVMVGIVRSWYVR